MGEVSSYRGRFAPSPTGDLHLGCAATALVTWLAARQAGGRLVLRVEDIDTPRIVRGSIDRQLEDLRWLGLDWDEGPEEGGAFGPYAQSQRFDRYEAALDDLAARDLLYYCDCSRAEIARVASAPHVGDEGPPYPGTCRETGLERREWKRPPAIRLRTPDREPVTVHDRFQGGLTQDVREEVGDFVLKRGDGVYSYQLAVVVDDLAMEITQAVRGADLFGSAPRQVLLAELLGGEAPGFAHAPLILATDGARLAKRARGVPLRDHRDAGRSSEELVGLLARTLGLVSPEESRVRPSDLRAASVLARLNGVLSAPLSPQADLPGR
ncbi:MAG: tRNA glutamyl-Q(34) synthetase GluQRS [Candidatus Binatia bacterium]|nr:tRNA glutamyl-Q(34) synthetase GluQRS [Candidatus Binatia bacterium]